MKVPISRPLNDDEFDRLGEFLETAIGGRAMNLEELDGFFAALLIGPDLVPPSEYLPEIFGGELSETCDFVDRDEANEIFGLLMQHWNAVNSALGGGKGFLPVLLKQDDGSYKGNDWAHGFMRGVRLRNGTWAELFQDEEHVAYLLPVLILHHENDEDPKTRSGPIPPEKRDNLLATLIAGVMGAYNYFREQRRAVAAIGRPQPRRVTKTGRNELCPCGSGKKYKRCCGTVTVH